MAKKPKSSFTRFKKDPAFKRAQRFPTFNAVMLPSVDVGDPALTALIRKLGGDTELAKRLISLQKKFPVATIPELLCYSWLEKEALNFDFQVDAMGGRRFHGGLVLDFLIYRDGTNADVWNTQGEFWHSISRKGFRDQTNNLRLLGQIINGVTVKRVIDLWEQDLYLYRPQIFYYALAGLPMRGVGGV